MERKEAPGSTIHSRGILRSRTDQTTTYLLPLTFPNGVVSSLSTAPGWNWPSTNAARGEKAFSDARSRDRCPARAARQEYRFFLKVSRRTFATTLRTYAHRYIYRARCCQRPSSPQWLARGGENVRADFTSVIRSERAPRAHRIRLTEREERYRERERERDQRVRRFPRSLLVNVCKRFLPAATVC